MPSFTPGGAAGAASKGDGHSVGDRVAGFMPEPAGDGGRHAGRRQPRGHLVLLLPRFRHPGGAGPLRPDRPEGPVQPRTATATTASAIDSLARVRAIARRAAQPARRWSSFPTSTANRISRRCPTPSASTSSLADACRSSISSSCPSTTRSTSCTPPAPPALPKCIVHGAGGTLIQHLKELVLHTDLKPRRPHLLLHHLRLDDVELAGERPRGGRDRAALRRLARFHPAHGRHPVRPAPSEEGMTVFGTSAKYLAALEKAGRQPRRDARPLPRSRTMLSTGLAAAPESFDFVYREIKSGPAARLHLRRHRHHLLLRAGQPHRARSIAASCRPRAGHEGRGLRRGRASRCVGEKGELVCTRAVSLHAGGLLERSRRRANTAPPISSTSRASGATATMPSSPSAGGMIIYGRSDATLNPGGVRIGTAEIYRQVEPLTRGAGEPRRSGRSGRATCGSCCSCACATGLSWMRPCATDQDRHPRNATPRHVPRKVIAGGRTSPAPSAARSWSSRCAT